MPAAALMHMSKKDDYNKLFQKIALIRFPLDSISEVEAFHQCCTAEQDQPTALQTENLMSLIYFINNQPDKSLEIDLKVMQELPVNNEYYGINLIRSTKTSAFLKKTELVLPYVFEFLKEPKKMFNVSIPLLHWYSILTKINDQNKQVIAEAVADAISQIGILLPQGTSLLRKIEILNAELQRAGIDLHRFRIDYQQTAEEERVNLIRKYLKNEPLKYYRNIILSDPQLHN
jgi:hypothetical protein